MHAQPVDALAQRVGGSVSRRLKREEGEEATPQPDSVLKMPEMPEMPEMRQEKGDQPMPEVPEVPEAAEKPEMPELPEMPEMPEIRQEMEDQETPEMPEIQEATCTVERSIGALPCTVGNSVEMQPSASPPAELVQAGRWYVLPNSRLGYAMEPVITDFGLKQVFRAADYKTVLCRHGESARSIAHRRRVPMSIPKEEAASGTGCDCQNVVLMRGSQSGPVPSDWAPPSSLFATLCELGAEEIDFGNVRLFFSFSLDFSRFFVCKVSYVSGYNSDAGARAICALISQLLVPRPPQPPPTPPAQGRKGRRLPCNRINAKLYCLPNDKLRCEHGNSEATVRAARAGRRKAKVPCTCVTRAKAVIRRVYCVKRCKGG